LNAKSYTDSRRTRSTSSEQNREFETWGCGIPKRAVRDNLTIDFGLGCESKGLKIWWRPECGAAEGSKPLSRDCARQTKELRCTDSRSSDTFSKSNRRLSHKCA
jgi:hypothetical protein